MSTVALHPTEPRGPLQRVRAFFDELSKLGAFLRRDFRTALTYKVGFVSDWVGLAFSVVLFYYTGKLVDSSRLPKYGGEQTGYLEFMLVGMALAIFVQIALMRVSGVMRQEQFAGTLESLLMTPTSSFVVQLGSVMYDLIFIPIRITLFLGAFAVIFGLNVHANGVAPALVYLAATVPFVWGLGLIMAGITMTWRRGGGAVALAVSFLMLASGAYFPVELFPSGIAAFAAANPLTVAVSGMRDAVLGGAGWSGVPLDLAILLPSAAASLLIGNVIFRFCVRRERGKGTLGLY